ncbi:hypothetical protein O6H91_Y367800 [Diphasiastrum complanatum]|nr:hypothetical protein O6H91_Y367800 [Diphasiastrum complanatum]
MEEDRKRKVGALSESEKLKREADSLTLSRAANIWQENLDDVKRMNQMMLYARCVAIRDEQKKEKFERMKEEERENQEAYVTMTQKTLRENEKIDELEKKKAEDRRQGALVLKLQIEEREAQHRIEDERKQLEGQWMIREMERLKQEESKNMQEKYEAGERLLQDIIKANDEQIEQKKEMAALEKEEEERINLYIKKKHLREQQYAEEQERIKKFREIETARLRSLQEKAQDKQAELDELRAQRILEASEREWREKERAEAERIKRMNEELAQAREEQRMFKVKQLAEQAKLEQAEFYKVIKEQQDQVLKLKSVAQEHHKRQTQHKEQILEQIRKRKEQRDREVKEAREEGERMRQRLLAEKQVLEQIKARKLKELQNEGIPPKYCAELARKKLAIA